MSSAIHLRNHPFRFLLYLEWLLLVIPTAIEFLPSSHFPMASSPPIIFTGMILFTAMGLYLPTGRNLDKILYSGLEFFLLVCLTLVGHIKLFPLIFVPVVLRSCLIFRLPGQLIVSFLTLLLFIYVSQERFKHLISGSQFLELGEISTQLRAFIIGLALLFTITITFLILLLQSLLNERQSRDQLTHANAQLREYALQIESLATVQERNRIAREIHDSLGHSLTALNIQLEGALKLWHVKPDQAQTFLHEAKRLGSTALEDVRHSVSTLRADPLHGETLPTAIRSLAKTFQSAAHVTPTLSLHLDSAPPLSFEIRSSLYRIVQESLTNIFKYAEASSVHIELQAHPDHLYLKVEDNGKGFQTDRNTSGFGLQGMRERAASLGGSFSLTSQPGHGCRIEVRVPLSSTHNALSQPSTIK